MGYTRSSGEGSGFGAGLVVGLLVIVLVAAVVAVLLFGGFGGRDTTPQPSGPNIEVNPPSGGPDINVKPNIEVNPPATGGQGPGSTNPNGQ